MTLKIPADCIGQGSGLRDRLWAVDSTWEADSKMEACLWGCTLGITPVREWSQSQWSWRVLNSCPELGQRLSLYAVCFQRGGNSHQQRWDKCELWDQHAQHWVSSTALVLEGRDLTAQRSIHCPGHDHIYVYLRSCYSWLPRWLSGEEPACQSRRHRFDPWVGEIPWRRKWQPTPVFLPGESHGERSLVYYSPWGWKELDATEGLSVHTHI